MYEDRRPRPEESCVEPEPEPTWYHTESSAYGLDAVIDAIRALHCDYGMPALAVRLMYVIDTTPIREMR